MWKSRCARHEQFSFNKFISIVIVRTRVEVCDGEQRFDSSCHCYFLCSGSTRINAANLSQVRMVGYVTGIATLRIWQTRLRSDWVNCEEGRRIWKSVISLTTIAFE